MQNTNAITATTSIAFIGQILSIAGHSISVEDARLDSSGAMMITRANVLDAKGAFVGMVGGADCSAWSIAVGNGWISGESVDGLHEAVVRVVELRKSINARVRKLHALHRDCGKRQRASVLELLRLKAAATTDLVESQAAKTVLFDVTNPSIAGALCPIAVRQGRL